jgi:hypothetical protein
MQQVADANDLAHQWSNYAAGLQRQIDEHRCPSGSGTTTMTTAQTHSVTNTVTEGAQQAPTGLVASIHAPTPSQGQTTEPAAMQLDESDFPSLRTTNASTSSGQPPWPTRPPPYGAPGVSGSAPPFPPSSASCPARDNQGCLGTTRANQDKCPTTITEQLLLSLVVPGCP